MTNRIIAVLSAIIILTPLTAAAQMTVVNNSRPAPSADKVLADSINKIVGQFDVYSTGRSRLWLKGTKEQKGAFTISSPNPLHMSVRREAKRPFFGYDGFRQLVGRGSVSVSKGDATLVQRTKLVIDKDHRVSSKKLNRYQVVANRPVGTQITVNGISIPVTRSDPRMGKNTAVLKSLTSYTHAVWATCRPSTTMAVARSPSGGRRSRSTPTAKPSPTPQLPWTCWNVTA